MRNMATEKKGKCGYFKPLAILLFAIVFLLVILQTFNKYFIHTESLDYNTRFKDVPLPKAVPRLGILEKQRHLRPKPSFVTNTALTVASLLARVKLVHIGMSVSPTFSMSISSKSQLQKIKHDIQKSVTTSTSNTLSILAANAVKSPLEITKDLSSIPSELANKQVKSTASTSVRLSTKPLETVTTSNRLNLHKTEILENEKKKLSVISGNGVTIKSCKPKHNVMFLKTHKTGSSTLTNVLNRYADEHNLTVALPKPGYNRFYYPSLFGANFVDRRRIPAKYPNILCNHARYKQSALESVMSKNATFITILRNPITNFESVFYYMEVAQHCGITGNDNVQKITRFLNSPCGLSGSSLLVKNGMLYDLGLSTTKAANMRVVKKHIQKLAKRFQLVLLMEYFDESLVLLKRLLCWELEDVAYFMFLKSATKRKPLPKTVQKRIRNWSSGDILLYEHFNQTFWQKIANEGKGFYKDVEKLRKLNLELKQKCIEGEYTHLGHRQAISRVKSFHMKKNVSKNIKGRCCRMLRSEVEYINYHRRRQLPGRTSPMPEC